MQGTQLDAVAKAVVEALDGPQRNTALCRQVVQLLAEGQPVSSLHLTGVLHRTIDEVRAELSTHPELEYDANGNIVGSGLTFVSTAYQVQMNDHRLFAWCALGALANPLQLQLSARILSRCPSTGRVILLTMTPQQLIDLDPPDAVMSLALPSASACCHDLRVVSPLNIFLDDGGVITDKQRRAAEFARLVGNCFVPLLGGTEEAWTCAHRMVADRLADPQSVRALATVDFVSFYQAYQLRWVGGMCELLGLPPPPEEECLDLASRALSWITRRIHAVLPGAVETIRLLHRQGYALYTASGSCSLELAGALEGMGVRHCFGRLYGADLINTFKDDPEYYARLFADVGI